MNTSCIEKNTFCCRCFTGINVCHNTNITCLLQGELSSHKCFSFLSILHYLLLKLQYCLTHLVFHSLVILPLFFPRVGVSNSQCNEALALVCAPDERP